MPVSKEEKEYATYVVDLMQSMGPLNAKRMFGGHGFFLERLMFALISDRTLYLKADKDSEKEFKVKGLEALKGSRKGQHSIRINDQWRICFTWKNGNADEVEIVDYH